jgi:hypothetical protein
VADRFRVRVGVRGYERHERSSQLGRLSSTKEGGVLRSRAATPGLLGLWLPVTSAMMSGLRAPWRIDGTRVDGIEPGCRGRRVRVLLWLMPPMPNRAPKALVRCGTVPPP